MSLKAKNENGDVSSQILIVEHNIRRWFIQLNTARDLSIILFSKCRNQTDRKKLWACNKQIGGPPGSTANYAMRRKLPPRLTYTPQPAPRSPQPAPAPRFPRPAPRCAVMCVAWRKRSGNIASPRTRIASLHRRPRSLSLSIASTSFESTVFFRANMCRCPWEVL